MRTCSVLALAFAALSGCRATPSAPVAFTLHYGGPGLDAPIRLEPGAAIDVPDRGERVLVARIKESDRRPIVPREPALDEPDARAAQRMAWIAQWVIRKELGIADGLGFIILLFPIESLHACVATAALPPELGVVAGVPTVNGAIARQHATAFLFELIHGYVEAYLSNPAIDGCTFYHRAPENRWIAEGIAGIVAERTFSVALKEGIELAPMSYVGTIDAECAKGRTDVQLAGWTFAASVAEPRSENLLRHAAAEFVCVRWYGAARKKGLERPIEELVKHVRGIDMGPSYDELTAWMRKVSGLDVERLARAVPVEDLRKYHAAAWEAMGWKSEPAPRK